VRRQSEAATTGAQASSLAFSEIWIAAGKRGRLRSSQLCRPHSKSAARSAGWEKFKYLIPGAHAPGFMLPRAPHASDTFSAPIPFGLRARLQVARASRP